MYNSNNTHRPEEFEVSDKLYITSGIHENVEIVSAKVDKSPLKGATFLEITFKDENGIEFKHTEWEPKNSENEAYRTDEAGMQKKRDNQFSRMMQILRCFYDDTKLVFSGASYKEFAEWIARGVNAADKSVKIRAKLVYDHRGYLTLPAYAKFAFVERMDVEKPMVIKLGIDAFEKPIIADKEEVKDPMDIRTSQATSIPAKEEDTNPNGLPF